MPACMTWITRAYGWAAKPCDENVDFSGIRRWIGRSVPTGMDAAGGKWQAQDTADASLPKTSGAAQAPHLASML